MPSSHLDTIRHHCLPLEPLPTHLDPVLQPLRDIHAVLFDVYGTLFISACGDVGTSTGQRRGNAFRDALESVGVRLVDQHLSDVQPASRLITAIQDSHARSRVKGINYPEVEIRSIWQATLEQLESESLVTARPDQINLATLAIEYEVRTNSTWPMPGALDCLTKLHSRGTRLGIVSNAQFFTPKLFPALLGKTTEELGFPPQLQFYSYQTGWAKPGRHLYQLASDALSSVGTSPREVLYIGNDMLNDIAAAQQVGFRTALFAGDARSLRLREEDDRVAGVAPDLVVTHLSQLPDCIECPDAIE